LKVGGNINFFETGGKCTKTGKTGGKVQTLWSMTKKRLSEILADENRNFLKSFSLKIFRKQRGNLKQGEMHHGLRGMDAPGMINYMSSLRVAFSESK